MDVRATTDVWFIRHGESIANAGAPTDDPATIPLTKKGWAEAAEVSASFERVPDLIVTSPFLRTHQTAQPTLARFPETPHEVWPVHEFTCLSPVTCRNTTAAQRHPRVTAFWNHGDPLHIDGLGAESFAQMLERVYAMLDRLEQLDSGLVAIFSHGQFIRATCLVLEYPDLPQRELMRLFSELEPIRNGEIVRAVVSQNRLCLC